MKRASSAKRKPAAGRVSIALGMLTFLSFPMTAVSSQPTKIDVSNSVSATVSNVDPKVCASWMAAEDAGKLDGKILNEASGLVASREFSRFYLINDSGDGPYFYFVDRNGENTKKVRIDGFKPKDVEDISLGPCPLGGGTCIAIADIGDNLKRRKNIEVVYIKETEKYDETVKPVARQKLTYPDHAHNAEAFAFLATGEIVIVSKEDQLQSSSKAFVFKSRAGIGETKLERIGEIDIPLIVGNSSFGGMVTGMSVTRDAKKVLLLTYDKAVEVAVDVAKAPWPTLEELKTEGRLSVISLRALPQQEAIAYDLNDRDFFYTSEIKFLTRITTFQNPFSPLLRVKCAK